MNLSNLKDRMQEDFQSIDDLQQIYEELEASYQQLLAMSDQLTQAENKYASLIQNMRDIVWVADPHGEILYINNTVTDILGYQMEEMVGRKLYEFMCPLHEYKTGFCKDVVARMNDVEFIRQEMWMLHKDGNTRKVLEVNSNHLIFEGELIEIQGVGRDITDRIQSERKIAQKNRQLSFISDISTSITSNLSLNNLDQLLNETCKSIVTTVGVPLCTIRIKDEEGLLNLKAVSGKYKDLIKAHPIDAFEGKLSDVMLKREPVIFSSEESIDHPSRVSDVFEKGKLKSLLVLPLKTNDDTVGLLSIGGDTAYDEDYTSLFSSLANNIAFAVEKSKLYQDLKAFYINIIMTLVAAMEAKDPYTQGHALRVSTYSVKIAKALGLSRDEIEDIEIAGILHDIGKIGISDTILSKPGMLTAEEFEIVKLHPSIGMRILEAINLSENIKSAILFHHLRVDLKGYPHGHELIDLPLFARIIGVADALDAMTSHRSYKKAMCVKDVEEELMRHSGTQFCPEVVNIAIELLRENSIKPLSETYQTQ